jgi:hypothetical protein
MPLCMTSSPLQKERVECVGLFVSVSVPKGCIHPFPPPSFIPLFLLFEWNGVVLVLGNQ